MLPPLKKHPVRAIACLLALAISMHGMAQANQPSVAGYSPGVLASCTIIGAAMEFGRYTSSQVDQNGNISVTCTNGVSYSVALDAGIGSEATTRVRKLNGLAGDTLNYALYRDPAHTAVWGSRDGTDTATGNGNGAVQNMIIYGRIPGGQAPLSGVYTDTVTITLTY